MEVRAVTPAEVSQLSVLSVSLGNVPLFPGKCAASLLVDREEIIGFAAAQSAWLAAGSWVKEEHRRNGYTYELRACLETELRKLSAPLYLSIPGSWFEQRLFAKYGPVTERVVQVKNL